MLTSGYNGADTKNLLFLADCFHEDLGLRFGPFSLSITLQPAYSQ